MKLSQLQNHLKTANQITFTLPDGSIVPPHFHITEIGRITRDFIDCGGKRRSTAVINMQILVAQDYDHRLSPEKLNRIIDLTAKGLELEDLEVRFEYQQMSISNFGAKVKDGVLQLTALQTACLAADECGIQQKVDKVKVKLSELTSSSCCDGAGCC
jgi:hypothetical protein